MRDLQRRLGTAIMLITHDLGVVAQSAHRVIVMYAGRKVEEASTAALFEQPMHPYTQGLLGAVPKLGSSLAGEGRGLLAEIDGSVPDLRKPIVGCAFASRCSRADNRCRSEAPVTEEKDAGHWVACHHAPAKELA